MPPRRSSRSRASVEPEPTLKRKRAASVIDVDAFSEKENVVKETVKQAATSTRSSRSTGKSRASLQKISEGEDDEQVESAPVKKKARPSLEPDEEDDEDEIQEIPEPAASRTARNSARASRKPVTLKKEEEAAPHRRTTRGPSANPPPSRVSARTSRSAKPARKVVTVESSDDDEKPSVATTSSFHTDQDTGMEDVDESKSKEKVAVKPPKRSTRGRKAPIAASTNRASRRSSNRSSAFDDDDEEIKPQILKKKAASCRSDDDQNQEPILPPVSEDVEDALPVEDNKHSSSEPKTDTEQEAPPPAPKLSTRTQPSQSQFIDEPKGPIKRLVISNLVLVNFKSYAGRQEIGPFHKSFSSIVGPNGSGKSNTIDALLFVFGYRANKMRQAKLSELIHHSAKYPDLMNCSVEVHFREIIDLEGPDDFEVVPGSSLVVTRTAYKDNTSKYTVNSKTVKHNDVRDLLRGRGIDLDHNRFLILQGEVESIALMKPKGGDTEEGLLEYLEDIIGTAQYKEPIEEALAKVEELQESRSEQLNRLRLVEKERDALEGRKKEVDEYFRLSNNLIRAQSLLWQFQLWEMLLKEHTLNDKLTAAQTSLTAEEDRNKENMSIVDQLEDNYKQQQEQCNEMTALAEQAKKQHSEQARKKAKSEEQQKHAAAKLKKLKKTVTDDENALGDAKRTLDDSSSRLGKHKKEIAAKEKELVVEEQALEAITESLKGKTQVFHDKIDLKQQELAPWKAKIDAKQAEIDVAASERDELKNKAKSVKEACDEAHQLLEGLQGDQAVKVKEYTGYDARRKQLKSDVEEANRRVNDATKAVHTCRANATSTRQTFTEARASQTEGRTQNHVLKTLTQFAAAGGVQGFHGRLGNLGKIVDEKYDVAVTTACGTLNHLVVDRVEQGQACIEHLRVSNAGRASIMVLEKVQAHAQHMAKHSTPENVPRLFDLITPKDPMFAAAFYKAAGETLVANDMEQATRIAFANGGRRRVVTLQGQMIESNGTMGGGGKAMSGGMSAKFTRDAVPDNVIRNYEQEHMKAEQALEAAQSELTEAEGARERLLGAGPNLDLEYEKLGMDIENGKRRIEDAIKRVKDLQAKNRPDAGDLARIKKLDKDIEKWQGELEALLGKAAKIDEAIKALEQQILDVGGSRLVAQRSKVEGVQFDIGLLNEQITRAEVENEKAGNDIKRLTKLLKGNREAMEAAEVEVKGFESDLAKINDFLDQLKEAVDQAKQQEETFNEHLQALQAEFEEKQEEVQAFKKEQARLQNAVNAAQKEVNQHTSLILALRDKHDALRLEEVDDDDDEEEIREGEKSPKAEENDVKPDIDMEDGSVKSESKERPISKGNTLPEYEGDQLTKMKKRDLTADVQLLQDQLAQKPLPNLSIRKEYKKKEDEFLGRAHDVEEVTKARDEQKAEYEGLRKRRLDEFMTGFNIISLKLKEMYQMITLGGNAELELVDSMDPFSEGIIFSVMPPKKSWKNISNLSGGEKTLSSLALVFALHVYKPTPLYFMDEIDAALDFRNVSIVANYIKDRTKNAQFIIISLRNNMFELSNRLIGIYKTSNATHSISIDNQQGQVGVLRSEST